MKILTNMAWGSAAGFLGAFAMSLIMALGKLFGFVGTPKPHQVEARLEARTGTDDDLSPEQGVVLAQGMHMVIGAGYGAGYGLLQSLLKLPAMLLGPIYGMLVYVINEIIAGPAFALTPPPTREPAQKVWRRLLMHFVYGITLGAVLHLANERSSRGVFGADGKPMIRID